MNRFLRVITLWCPVLTLIAISSPCNTTAEPADPALSESHTDLLCTLEITGDSCYASLRPDPQSEYFGPLDKGEKVKWLNSQGDWIQVWIPRLMISGWILRTNASETAETPSNTPEVPENLLMTVTVVAEKANLREAPTTNSNNIATVQEGQTFWLLNRRSKWHQIWHSDLKRKGWISGELIATSPKAVNPL